MESQCCSLQSHTIKWSLKARANARNIVGPNTLRAFAHHVVCCCVLLRLVGSCWMKFETGQTSAPTRTNISIVSPSSKRGPTMLRSFAQHILHKAHPTTPSNKVAPAHAHYMLRIHTNTCEQEINMASEMENVPESFVFSSKDPTCCDLLRAFAHIG